MPKKEYPLLGKKSYVPINPIVGRWKRGSGSRGGKVNKGRGVEGIEGRGRDAESESAVFLQPVCLRLRPCKLYARSWHCALLLSCAALQLLTVYGGVRLCDTDWVTIGNMVRSFAQWTKTLSFPSRLSPQKQATPSILPDKNVTPISITPDVSMADC